MDGNGGGGGGGGGKGRGGREKLVEERIGMWRVL